MSYSTASVASSAPAVCGFAKKSPETNELAVINRGDHSTIALFSEQELDNPLSANVVDICPVGALTDRDFRFKVTGLVFAKDAVDLPRLQHGL